ncbi:hypothetical protein BDL97_06G115300 [Sphagnum fallax]|nr:hypothetical protein BDL97_06G115300 [Sphagnum fallax]
MQPVAVRLVPVSFVGVLNACAGVLALEEGTCAHKQIVDSGWDLDVFVSNSLIDKHAKCGSMEFTFQSVYLDAITRCLVDEGMHCYGAMSSIYTISEELEHYTFMVDLLGCAGHLQETENMSKSTP